MFWAMSLLEKDSRWPNKDDLVGSWIKYNLVRAKSVFVWSQEKDWVQTTRSGSTKCTTCRISRERGPQIRRACPERGDYMFRLTTSLLVVVLSIAVVYDRIATTRKGRETRFSQETFRNFARKKRVCDRETNVKPSLQTEGVWSGVSSFLYMICILYTLDSGASQNYLEFRKRGWF